MKMTQFDAIKQMFMDLVYKAHIAGYYSEGDLEVISKQIQRAQSFTGLTHVNLTTTAGKRITIRELEKLVNESEGEDG